MDRKMTIRALLNFAKYKTLLVSISNSTQLGCTEVKHGFSLNQKLSFRISKMIRDLNVGMFSMIIRY